ncbi:hypothetical protein SMIB22_00480 [Streptococcus mitis]
MFSELRMREEQALLAQDYALEQAEEQGLERTVQRVLNRDWSVGKLKDKSLPF